MKYIILLCAIFLLQGCIGTQVFEPDVDVEESDLTLHTVPERPKPKDFPKLRKEWKQMKKYNKPTA